LIAPVFLFGQVRGGVELSVGGFSGKKNSMSGLMQAKVLSKEAVATDVFAFRLEVDDLKCQPQPGAHIDVHLGKDLIRQYSIVSAQGSDSTTVLRIGVLKGEGGRGGSVYLCDKVKVGDILPISNPRNNFELDLIQKSYHLVAGGIGITPLLFMAERLHILGRTFVFHVLGRTPEKLGFYEEIRDAPYSDRVKFYFSGVDTPNRMDVEASFLQMPEEAQIYACGPAGLLEEIDRVSEGWPLWRVRCEKFSGAEVSCEEGEQGDFKVQLAKCGTILDVPANKTLLEVLRDHGMDVPSSCEEGVCGTCVTQVVSGDIIHKDACLYDEERNTNTVIACCVSRGEPGTALVLDL